MKFTTVISAVLLGICVGIEVASADTPPLDRPTPPPCCADGICYPNPTTFGVYPTRWRRWPGDFGTTLEPTSAPPRPGQLGPDVPPYQTPTPEEEDRRAPLSTRHPLAEESAEGAPAAEPGTTPLAPPGPAGPAPTSPLERPSLETPPGMPWDNGEPTTETDPPPAPPFAAIPSIVPTARTTVAQPRTPQNGTPLRFPTVQPKSAPANDPPPALPLTLSSNGSY